MTKSSPSIWRLLHSIKSPVKILSIFVAFLENMNFSKALYSFMFGLNTLQLLNVVCSGLITTLPIPIMISERTVVVLVTRCFYKHSGYIYDFFHNDLDYTLLNWFDISDFSVKVFIASRVSSKWMDKFSFFLIGVLT